MDFEQKTLAHINIVKGIANTLGGGFNKNFGQNFLINQNSLLKFLKSIHLSSNDIVIEIGPGIGVVSYSLCETAKKVYLIEIDRSKEQALAKVLENFTNYEIIWADASNFDYKELVQNILKNFPDSTSENIKFIGSLPYNVGKKIIYQILTSTEQWNEASFFLQREVADNYVAKPPKAEFLAIFASIFAETSFAFGIPADHFIPVPKVKTGVIHLKHHDLFNHVNKIKFSAFIKSGYEQPRKTVVNNLKSMGLTPEIMQELKIKEMARPSELTLNQWELLFNRLVA